MKTWAFAMASMVGLAAMLAGNGTQASESSPDPVAPAVEGEHGFTPALATIYISDIQQQLTARGYYGGPIDGRITPSLRTAISVYQSDVGMKVTGIADLAVVNMLRFGPKMRATIQPLGAIAPEIAAPPPPREPEITPPDMPKASGPEARARPSDVPPYVAPIPYRYPTFEMVEEARASEAKPWRDPPKPATAQRKAARSEEPPLPVPAPQHKVETSPLPPVNEGEPGKARDPDSTKL